MKTTTLTLLFTLLLTPLSAETEPVDALLAASRQALGQGDAAKAVELAEQAVAARPERADTHAMLGSALGMRIGQVNFMQQAIMSGRMLGAFEKAVELDPDYLPGRIGLVRYYAHAPAIAGGSRVRAEREAEEIRRRDAYQGALELAYVAERFDDAPRAFEHLTAAAELRPTQSQPHLRMGALCEKLNRRAEARQHFARALELDPQLAPARDALSRLAEAQP